MPLSFYIGKKKYGINLNYFRNWHYQVSKKIKGKYADHALPQLQGIKFTDKVSITFILWKRDNRRIERANPLSIHEKFFCDAMVKAGCLPDDNDDYIQSSHYYTGGVDKLNPRVDVIISQSNPNALM